MRYKGESNMFNIGTVIGFEIKRTLKKKSFWIGALSVPALLIGVVFIIWLSNKSASETSDQFKNERYSLVVLDESERVNPALLSQFGAQTVENKQKGIDQVESGTTDAFFYYPNDVAENPVEAYAKDTGMFENSKYQAVAEMLLEESVAATVNPADREVLRGNVAYETTTYRDGEEYNPLLHMIAPGIFLVLFYFLIAMFGSQMLTSTTEEKENRVIEMLLTTIEAKSLIVGKIIALILLAFIQALVVILPILVLYLLFKDQLNFSLPVELSAIPIDGERMALGALIFIGSYGLFTGLLVAIGAAVPTAKEANGFLGVVFMLLFAPLYAVSLIISSPDSLAVQILSYFPLTAPIPLLLRNAAGTLPLSEGLVAAAILAVCAVIAMWVAIRLFRYGAIEYSNRLSFKTLFK